MGVVVSVSSKGLLLISTIPELRFLRARQLNYDEGYVPTKIVIAEEMGYIVVFLAKDGNTLIQNLTINGTFIKEVAIMGVVSDAVSYITPAYLDMIAILSGTYLVLIDAFTLEVWKRIKHGDELIKVQYHTETGNIVVATSDHLVLLIPTFFM